MSEENSNDTRLEIRNCSKTEFQNIIAFPLKLNLDNNKTFQIFIQNSTDEYYYKVNQLDKWKEATKKDANQQITKTITSNETHVVNRGIPSHNSSDDHKRTDIIFFYLTIGLGSLVGILIVALIILGALFRLDY